MGGVAEFDPVLTSPLTPPTSQNTSGCADFVHGEVAVDYNAGFTSAVAGLKHLSLERKLPVI